jgi:RNA recognition motif-containing protein
MWQIFVGGIDSDVTDEDLRQPFSQFGEVVSVKMPTGKGCAFVQFANRYPCFPSFHVGLGLFTCCHQQE